MDWNNLQESVRNLSLYDVKANIRKVQNAVMNFTEMESKVREATNNEPWGASSTLMQEIANGTFNYQQLNEIMPMIYKRFTEKSAEEWRQIYKALQLMEFLIKNGSERVIDDARSHLSLLKMLRQFHYIDQNGKDQGINVRNRSKELTDLLSDVEKIRAERKKAKATRNKYRGVEGGAGLGGVGLGGGSSSRYGGFGSESAGASSGYGGSTRAVYGDGGGFGGEQDMDYDEPGVGGSRQEKFDEYDEFDDGGAQARPGRRQEDSKSKASQKKPEPPKPKEPEVDLFDFGDDNAAPAPSNNVLASNTLAAPSSSIATAPAGDEDDFDDFQSAAPTAAPAQPAQPALPKPNYSSFSTAQPTSTTQYAQPTPQSNAHRQDFSNLFATTSPAQVSSMASPPPQQNMAAKAGYQPTGPNYFTSVSASTPAFSTAAPGLGTSSPVAAQNAAPAKKPAGGDAFASLLSGTSIKKPSTSTPKGLTMADMAKQKSQAGLYGAPAAAPLSQPQAPSASQPNTGSSGLDDLLG